MLRSWTTHTQCSSSIDQLRFQNVQFLAACSYLQIHLIYIIITMVPLEGDASELSTRKR
jgi:hypothetical protein